MSTTAIAAIVAGLALLIVLAMVGAARSTPTPVASAGVPTAPVVPDLPPIMRAVPGEFPVCAVGESHYRKNFLAICGAPTEDGEDREVVATLMLDDRNQYDTQAVRIDVGGRQVGHLSREEARKFRRRLDETNAGSGPFRCPAHIAGGWQRPGNDRGDYGVRLALHFGKRPAKPRT